METKFLHPESDESRQLHAVNPGEINYESPLTAADILYSLERTPTPRRFDRRRQRIRERIQRTSREVDVIQDIGRSTTIGGVSTQNDSARRAMNKSPPHTEHCQRPCNDAPDGAIRERAVYMAQLALLESPVDVSNRKKANEVTGERGIGTLHPSINTSLKPIASSLLLGKQQYLNNAADSSLFISADDMHEDEESDETNRAHSRHNYGKKIKAAPRAGPEQNNGLKRPSRKLLKEVVTYGNQSCPKHCRPGVKARFLQESIFDVPYSARHYDLSHPVDIANVEIVGSDNDTIESSSPSPPRSPRRAQKGHEPSKFNNKRKALSEIPQNLSKPNAMELSMYKLPNTNGMSPKTKKRLKMSMTCSDGFEGSESRPTGRTMPMRAPRSSPKDLKEIFARVTKLTLAPFRGINENIPILQRLHSQSSQANEVTTLYHKERELMQDSSDSLSLQIQSPLQEGNQVNSQLEGMSQLPPTLEVGDIHTNMAAAVITPPNTRWVKRGLTFSDDVNMIFPQELKMVSAPIWTASLCDSDNLEHGTNDDESNETSSKSSKEDGSDEETEGESDFRSSSEDGNSDPEIDTQTEEAPRIPRASLEAAPNSLELRKEPLEELKHSDRNNSQESDSNHKVALLKRTRHDSTHGLVYSPDSLYLESPCKRGKPSVMAEYSQSQEINVDDHWRPRMPVPGSRRIEVDDETMSSAGSSSGFSEGDIENRRLNPRNAGKYEVLSCDGHPLSRSQPINDYMRSPQGRNHSCASVELGDPNWSVPHRSGDEQAYYQSQSSDHQYEGSQGHLVEEYRTSMIPDLESFGGPFQAKLGLIRSMSIPQDHLFHHAEGQLQKWATNGTLKISLTCKYTVLPRSRSLSHIQNAGSKKLAESALARGRVPLLSLNPPFLRK